MERGRARAFMGVLLPCMRRVRQLVGLVSELMTQLAACPLAYFLYLFFVSYETRLDLSVIICTLYRVHSTYSRRSELRVSDRG